MKTLSANLKTHLAGSTVTLAHLWLCTLANGTIHAFTDHDQDIVYGDVTYLAASGFTASKISTTLALNVDNLEVQGMLNNDTITDADLLAGLWDYAQITLSIVNYADLTMGLMQLRTGWLGNVKSGRQHFYAELRGMMQPLQQVVGRVYTPGCDVALGSAKCGIVLASYTVTGSITGATDSRVFTDSTRAEASGYFEGGLITWTSGLNNAYRMEVKTFAAGVVTLQQSMVNAVQVGDTYSMSAGCDKLLATCKTKFNNVVNFRGFPHVPGQDKMISGPATMTQATSSGGGKG